jgi:hypothetical protein
MQTEDYKGARILATVEHLGETFQIVRWRVNGKPWRKYMALLYGGIVMSYGKGETNPTRAATEFKHLFEKTFTDRTEMLTRIQTLKHQAAGHCD